MLQGKTAVVTGASRGIGRAIALEMASQGADVAVVYAGNQEKAQAVAEEIAALGQKARAYQCDVRSFAQTKEVIDQILADFGGVDILVNNAGITKDGLMLTMSEQSFDDVVDTSLKGAFHTIRHLYSHFMKKRAGRILNITSVAGLMGNGGQTNYASAKAGMIGLTKSVAKELAGRNVTCNAIAPGFIETDMTEKIREQSGETITAAIPLKRVGKPEEVAKLAAFLAGESAGYITGEVIKIDGGLYI